MRGKRGKFQLTELEAIGLYLVHNNGSGNCLFDALSDQLHGDDSKSVEYRAATIAYMRAHPSRFIAFLPTYPGGGIRRNPKRKNPGTLAKPVDTQGPTAEEVEAAYETHLRSMEKGGSYGDNMEVVAFANAYKVDVNIYTEETKNFVPIKCDDRSGGMVKRLYIVLHKWEHFASIRNKSGPHTGPPKVICDHPSLQAGATTEDAPTSSSSSQIWMIDSIQRALPYPATREAIKAALEAYQGNMTKAVSALMPASSSSSSRSSSIERDLGPDEEIDLKPKKKLDRRSSRPQPLHLGKSNKNFTANLPNSNSVSPDPAQLSAALSKLTGDEDEDPDATDEEDWHIQTPYRDSETTSVSTSASDSSTASKGTTGSNFRLKLSQPKKPVGKLQPNPTDSSEKISGVEYDADGEKPPSSRVIAKPRRRLITGAQRERERIEKGRKAARRTSLSPTSANSKQSSQTPPVIDDKIKVLSL